MAGLDRPWQVFFHIYAKSTLITDQANSIKSRLGSTREKDRFRNGPLDVQYLFVCLFVNIIRSDVPAVICMYLLVLDVLLP